MKKAPLPKRPFRDSALIYGAMAVVFVVFAVVTGQRAWVAVAVAGGCFVLATGYAWWRFRQRIEEEKRTP